MEVVVESAGDHTSTDNGKLAEVSEKLSTVEEDVCQKSNGVVEAAEIVSELSMGDNDAMPVALVDAVSDSELNAQQTALEAPELQSCDKSEVQPIIPGNSNVDAVPQVLPDKIVDSKPAVQEIFAENIENIDTEPKSCHSNDVQMEEVVESEIIDTMNDNVRFETEIVVESNDINEIEVDGFKTENESSNNILSDLDQNIELSDVLRSSDVAENVENNNCSIRQEVFNKEELLDILEGNDVPPTGHEYVEILGKTNMLESQLALEQLSRLKGSRKMRDTPRKKNVIVQKQANDIRSVKQKSSKEETTGNQKASKEESVVNPMANKKENTVNQKPQKKDPSINQKPKPTVKEVPEKQKNRKDDSIVNALVQDWEDEEATDDPKPKEALEEEPTQPKEDNTDIDIKEETANDLSIGDDQTLDSNKSFDDGQPQKRLGRVIKKKVIFDPDNPDTYTKSKSIKNKESDSEKEQHPAKKAKLEQTILRAKSKSPVSKMQWKKPQPKNSKQTYKRLSEVDKLLMDEGAVNMIYQLTPEAPKGRKNMRTKAEFIKKVQSSTPESKEMKFRERKKELSRSEDGEPKKILSGKQRSSLSSSVKSPSVSEDFEAHSADDSIIYRRHSSSSYSSTCMSPRRLSDVNDEANHSAVSSSQLLKESLDASAGDGDSVTDVFQLDASNPTELINKDDCLSIKKKLNSKLSLALNKRKREISKSDKPLKKRAPKIKEGDQAREEVDKFKFVTVTYDQRVADICIRKSGSKYNMDVLKEMEEALFYVNARKDISVTLLTSECGALCSDLDLISLLDDDGNRRAKTAVEIADSVRSLLSSVEQHGKLVCSGVWGACWGVGLALAALSDVCVASERATFAYAPGRRAPLPGLAAFRAGAGSFPQSTINDLVIFGRELSAAEALQNGLVSRVLWPSGVADQIKNIVKEIAAQPPQTLLLKKKLLNLKRSSESTFQSQLEAEAALMVEYWSSEESQDALRAHNDAV